MSDPDKHEFGEQPLGDKEENASHNTDGTNTSASASDGDVEMFSARESTASDENPAPAQEPMGDIPVRTTAPQTLVQSSGKDDNDLLPRIRGMFRLLDLISERSSSGIVDKIIISQESVATFINEICPGAYASMTKIDFSALDTFTLKPIGVYGSIPAIIDFLSKAQCIDENTVHLLATQHQEGTDQITLRPGLYLLNLTHVQSGLVYVIFWPEATTWDDNSISSVSRNRATFIRFLTKLCDQVLALVSAEHEKMLVLENEDANLDNDPEMNFADDSDRLFQFKVQQTIQQEETASAGEGFKVPHSCMRKVIDCPEDFNQRLQPRLVFGDLHQALLSAEYKKEHFDGRPIGSVSRMMLQTYLARHYSPRIVLEENIDFDSLLILLNNGLATRCHGVYEGWRKQQSDISAWFSREEKDAISGTHKQALAIYRRLGAGLVEWLAEQTVRVYPCLEKGRITSVISRGIQLQQLEQRDLDMLQALGITGRVEEMLEQIDSSSSCEYARLKRRFQQHQIILQSNPDLSNEQIKLAVDAILTDEDLDAQMADALGKEPPQSPSRGITATLLRALGAGSERSHKSSPKRIRLPFVADSEFLAELHARLTDRPVYKETVEKITISAGQQLCTKLTNFLEESLAIANNELMKVLQQEVLINFAHSRGEESSRANAELRTQVRGALAKEHVDPGNRDCVLIRGVTQERRGYSGGAGFYVDGDISTPVDAKIFYRLGLFELKEQDVHALTLDEQHISQPIIRDGCRFNLPLTSTIRFMRLIGDASCLLITQCSPETLNVYMSSIHMLDDALKDPPKKTFHLSKLGQDPLFALDESRRLLVVYSNCEGHVRIIPFLYEYPNAGGAIMPRGAPINITRWFDDGAIPEMQHIVFLSGTEELLLVDETGLARIFSLVTEQFRPAIYKFPVVPTSVHSLPDGTAFLALYLTDRKACLRCHHLASFGMADGIELELPSGFCPDETFVVSGIGRKESPHGIFVDTEQKIAHSAFLHITSKASEFAFRPEANERMAATTNHSVHNSLIDCHAEVWTRYPVQAIICRETAPGTAHCPRMITFVSSRPRRALQSYFKALVRSFEQKTRKPTRRLLAETQVEVMQTTDPLVPYCPTSQFKAGDWLVGLFCLIPIHIAITKHNRFKPLRDGVDDPGFERMLLGREVASIAQSLSLGWYESIFASYMARKPVKVVTSMGEQSVGKSYALNHFVDTSFAGSAMRCTEGVWLSITPTRDTLIVSMDFEAVNSIERSAQEDMLLVLFNAAISNLVLFRNNFALSRDITNSFKSFQSSTKVLDPATNPSLFQSTLAIIIKDVIDSDTREVVSEFSLKFQRIVQDEAGDNFISKLHRGKLAIIPWPVIESTRFYELFGSLKTCLDKQPVTHKSAGEFLTVLKMLMAKLKACDWGALDQNLAVQRVQLISPHIKTALIYGTLDPQSNTEPLKNLDTDEAIPGPPSNIIFYLAGADFQMLPEECLAALRASWEGQGNRFRMSEDIFLAAFNQYLQTLVDARVHQVQTWLEENTERYRENSEVQLLYRQFEEMTKELKGGLALCGVQCAECSLLCINGRQHNGPHDCNTSHKCIRLCEFIDQHENNASVPICEMPAGHSGRHLCKDRPHQCGLPCVLDSKAGCLRKCCKPIDHDDEEHLCAANKHSCGAPCSLQKEDVVSCSGLCVIDCRQDHERHCCPLALSCPVKCQLCNSRCSAGDHFHALADDAVHLCGQRHSCPLPCQMMGICHVETAPQAVECTFVGKHERFQYTKFIQIARRLPCVVPIPPNELGHLGRHVHSIASDAVHFCSARCGYCNYYCTYPLGHSQREHSTSHGSMSNAIWFVHGDDDEINVEGRRYAAGDSGAPLLCSLVCKSLGRHIHVDTCRSSEAGRCGGGLGVQHIEDSTGRTQEDLVTHRVFWQRSGFADPYTHQEQSDFDLCDHRCGGIEHNSTLNPGSLPSYCILPLFHPRAEEGRVNFSSMNGYVSRNGHAFPCKNPTQMQRAFHIVFVVDRSTSMTFTDRQPLQNTPMARRIVGRHNNRYGAVLSALWSFWHSREVATRNAARTGARQDTYSVVLFGSTAEIVVENSATSTAEELVELLLNHAVMRGTHFDNALISAREIVERHTTSERTPVVIFLSDGESRLTGTTVYDLCQAAVRGGSALSLHAVSFGSSRNSGILRRMAEIATQVHSCTPCGPFPPLGTPCSYSTALDTIQLADTFLAIADSLQNPRAALKKCDPAPGASTSRALV